MTLSEYFETEPLGSIAEMADYLGISRVWMSQLIHEKKKPSHVLAKRIELATQGLVKKEELRPDVFLV
jgi:DNA-binding transcriptional regulator YdaS (Cro superfamily)